MKYYKIKENNKPPKHRRKIIIEIRNNIDKIEGQRNNRKNQTY